LSEDIQVIMVGVRLASTRVWRRGLRRKMAIGFEDLVHGLVDGVSGAVVLPSQRVLVLM
jgi:hypothetical protein